MTQNEKELKLTWKKVVGSTGPLPKPRHGHRVYNVNELMVIISNLNFFHIKIQNIFCTKYYFFFF